MVSPSWREVLVVLGVLRCAQLINRASHLVAGDVYRALDESGVLDALLAQGKEFVFSKSLLFGEGCKPAAPCIVPPNLFSSIKRRQSRRNRRPQSALPYLWPRSGLLHGGK
jgi:hypothetical protein